MPTAYYIDDDEQEASDYIARLNGTGRLHVEYMPPPPDLSLDRFDPGTDLFFVDWALDEILTDTHPVNYRGHTFAAQLRDRFPDKPIVLITKKEILDRNLRRTFLDSLHLFNADIYKSSVYTDAERVVREIEALIHGFELLRQAARTWQGLMEAIGARNDEFQLLGAASPPLKELEQQRGVTWDVSQIAIWLQNVILKFPGILYDPLHAATYLGIEREAFQSEDVQRIFEPALYSGPFQSQDGYWWRNRLTHLALQFIRQAGIGGTSVNRNFGPAFEKVHGLRLPPAICISSGVTPADWVCYILKQPVRTEYSLVYYPDNRPAIMDDARVSFKAIRESNEVIDELFDSSSQPIIEQIRAAVQ